MSIKGNFIIEYKQLKNQIVSGFNETQLIYDLLKKHKNEIIAILGKNKLSYEIENSISDNNNYINQLLLNGSNNNNNLIGICKVIDKILFDALNKLENMAKFDNLTRLPNALASKDEGTKLLENNVFFHLIYIDLDNFKFINDNYGHDVGDTVLQEFSKMLLTYFGGENNFVCRKGGDEFLILSKDDEFLILENEKKLNDNLIKKGMTFINNFGSLMEFKLLELSFGISNSSEEILFDRDSMSLIKNGFNDETYFGKRFRGLVQLADDRMRKHKKERKK